MFRIKLCKLAWLSRAWHFRRRQSFGQKLRRPRIPNYPLAQRHCSPKRTKTQPENIDGTPGHLERRTGGTKIADIESHVVVKESFPENYFDKPLNAVVRRMCHAFQPAVPENTPQPPAKTNSDNVTDVVVHGAQCDYKPGTQLADFVVHFKGWE
jgi:hypothetical protein